MQQHIAHSLLQKPFDASTGGYNCVAADGAVHLCYTSAKALLISSLLIMLSFTSCIRFQNPDFPEPAATSGRFVCFVTYRWPWSQTAEPCITTGVTQTCPHGAQMAASC